MHGRSTIQGPWRTALAAALLTVVSAGIVLAQRTNGTIRGVTRDSSGPVPGVVVTATDVASGIKYTATTQTDGSFVILEVDPGEYEVTTSIDAFQDASGKARVLVGQTATLEFTLALKARATESVTVTAAAVRDYDLRTPEVSTNVTPQQIKELPQSSRNFLNFASLAPGVAVTADFGDDTRYGGAMFRSGGQDARQVNVFIDGLSFKNDILKGGAFMQDSSRGNPFPQDSISEFQVLTQNYKAEYERAAAAVINVSTKSGTNALHGDAFVDYQSRGMVAKTQFQSRTPDYHRYQWGVSAGGPFIQDKLFGFVSYEGNDQARFNNVLFGHPSTAPPEVLARFAGLPQGDVEAPFDSTLIFTKLTFQPVVGQTGELTGNYRDESDRRDFGDRRAFTTGVDQQVKTYAVTGKLDSVIGKFVNSGSLSYQQQKWIQGAIDASSPHQNYFDIAEIGGRSTIQNIRQRRFTVRDVGTFLLGSRGEHVAKAGITFAWANYDYDNAQDFNPNFFFRSQDQWLFPYHANFGFGQSAVAFSNRQFGVFLQDDWSITPQLQVNVGVRWDYESNMLNNDFVTPANVVAGANAATGTDFSGHVVHLGDIIDLNDYISTGSNRSSFKNAFQPRIGLSYDILGNGNTVFTGAWGRYYDHVNLQDIYLEQQRQTWKYFQFCFTDPRSTAPPDCGTPVPWKDSYLSRAGLEGLIASGAAGGPEIYFLQNSTKPPRTDQWNVGFHQRLGPYLFGMSYNNVRGYNGLIWFPAATPDATPDRPGRFDHLIRAPGFGTILYSSYDRRTWYDAIFVTAERPFTVESNWGFTIAYTFAKSRQLGNENKIEGTAFGFDFFAPANLRKVRGDNDERHHVTASAIVGLPLDVRFSTFLTLGSGVPFTIFDFSREAASIRWNGGDPHRTRNIFGLWAYNSLDLRLSKDFPIAGGVRAGIKAEVFNVTNFKNFCGFEGFYLATNLGQPNCQYNPRRAQLGANVSF
jgi:outer membrane receptor protein involved in Fe transport